MIVAGSTVHAAFAVLLSSTLAGAIHTWDAARDAAVRDHKPVLVEVGAAWCGPCKAFARATAGDPAVQKALGAVVLWCVDSETEAEGRALARKHAVQGLPTFLLLDISGAVLDRWTGFADGAAFVPQLAAALQDPLPVEARAARFETHPTAADALRLGRIRSAESNLAAALQYYTRACELDPEGGHEFETLRTAAGGFATGGTKGAEVGAAADAFLARPVHAPAEWIACAEWMKLVAQRSKSPAMAWPALRAVAAHGGEGLDSTLALRRDALLVDYALEIERDPARALEYKRRTLPRGFEDDPRAVNAFAWWCLKYAINYPEAERLTRNALARAAPGRDRAMLLDTAAEIRAARGDAREAAQLAAMAAREAPDNPYYGKQMLRFRAQADSTASKPR